LILIWLLKGIANNGYCQTYLNSADSLFKVGNFEWAALAYERCIFLADDTVNINSLLIKKTAAYKQNSQFDKATATLQRIDVFAKNESFVFEIKQQIALCAFLDKNFAIANLQFVEMYQYFNDTSILTQSLPLQALILNEMLDYKKAKQKLIQYTNTLMDISAMQKNEIIQQIDEMYLAKNLPRLLNMKKLETLSIFPGLGQLYAGYYKEAFINGMLNVLAMGYVVYNVYTGLYFTGLTFGSQIFSMFYSGGGRRATYLAEKHNYESSKTVNENLKSYILKLG
jgi:hypothetical protein